MKGDEKKFKPIPELTAIPSDKLKPNMMRSIMIIEDEGKGCHIMVYGHAESRATQLANLMMDTICNQELNDLRKMAVKGHA